GSSPPPVGPPARPPPPPPAEHFPPPPLPAADRIAIPRMQATNKALLMPPERSADLQAHWALRRDYIRDRDERRADDEEQRVRSLREDLAIENLFSIGAALVRESKAARTAGASALAVQRCKLAVEMAPGLVAAHTCLARALLADSVTAVKPAALELTAAILAGLRDPRVSRAALANLLSILFVAVLATTLAFVVVLFLRHANLYAHD